MSFPNVDFPWFYKGVPFTKSSKIDFFNYESGSSSCDQDCIWKSKFDLFKNTTIRTVLTKCWIYVPIFYDFRRVSYRISTIRENVQGYSKNWYKVRQSYLFKKRCCSLTTSTILPRTRTNSERVSVRWESPQDRATGTISMQNCEADRMARFLESLARP